jgi:hypothetical protein
MLLLQHGWCIRSVLDDKDESHNNEVGRVDPRVDGGILVVKWVG